MTAQNNKKLKRFVEIVLLIPTLIWVYSPIIAGIIFAMVWMFPAAFTSWWLFAYLGEKNWLLGIISANDNMITLIVIEFLIFGIGLSLFIWGVYLIAKSRLKNTGLVKTGPYKYIRHPQHLGIILMSFSISLYIPWTSDEFIRIGEIVSWSFFSLILFLISDLEEKKLAKKFGREFDEYRCTTGFFFPRVLQRKRRIKSLENINYLKRYLFTGIGFISLISLISLMSYILKLPKIGIVGHLFDFLSKEFWYFNLIFLGCFVVLIILKKYGEKKINKIAV